jgi:3-hydroxyisobutyrate dehydrogenase-like beta-hydroxyacid dehydrogenase
MSAIAFLGLGRMGRPMAANLVARGHQVTVWNRTASTAEAFAAEHPAATAPTPGAAVQSAEFVVSMLADDAALLGAYLGKDGVLETLPANAVCVDMATVSPGTVARLHDLVTERGSSFVDAPVSGSVAAATAATLTIMAAGEPDAVERARSVLDHLGAPVIAMGPSGAGCAMKLVVNAILHSLNGAVSEALVLAERAGIERTDAYAVLVESAVAAPFVQYRRASFERPDESPVAFRLDLAAKDIRLALALAADVGADLPQARTNLDVLTRAVDAGFEDRDETALAEYLRLADRPLGD